MSTAPADPAEVPVRPRRRFPRKIVLIIGCVAAGLAGSLGLRPGEAAPAESDGLHFDPTSASAALALPPEPEARTDADRIDLALRSGDFGRARELIETATGLSPGALAYREGLALEGLGRMEEAAAAYERAADQGPPALLGRVRCAAAAGEVSAARTLLNQATLQAVTPNVRGECLHLRARLAILDLHPAASPDPLDPTDVAWPPVAGALPPPVDWLLTKVEENDEDDVDVAPTVSTRRPAGPLAGLLTDLATQVKLTLWIDSEAAAAVATDVPAVAVEEVPLEEVLAALLSPHSLMARIDRGLLVIAPDPAGRADREAAAVGALRRAIDFAPTHPLARAAEVWLANLDATAGRWRPAQEQYRRFLAANPHATEGVYTAYNLGLSELRAGNFAAARERFAEIVDRAPTPRWADLGWWWVGRCYLDGGDPESAIRYLKSARESSSRELSSAATLGLCLAHLLSGDESAARAVLRNHRVSTQARHDDLVRFLEALLQFRLSPTDGRRDMLLEAAATLGDGAALGPAGSYLVGLAYRDAGRPDRMVEVFDRAAAACRGPLAIQMTFAAAERLFEIDRRGPARSRYLAVAAADPDGLGPRAQLRVAELAARDGKGAECVRRSRAVADRSGIDRAELLPILARGYELEHEYRKAAEALAGRLPAE